MVKKRTLKLHRKAIKGIEEEVKYMNELEIKNDELAREQKRYLYQFNHYFAST